MSNATPETQPLHEEISRLTALLESKDAQLLDAISDAAIWQHRYNEKSTPANGAPKSEPSPTVAAETVPSEAAQAAANAIIRYAGLNHGNAFAETQVQKAIEAATADLQRELAQAQAEKERLNGDLILMEQGRDVSRKESAKLTAKNGELFAALTEARAKLVEIGAAFDPCENGHGMQTECYGCQRDRAIAERDELKSKLAEAAEFRGQIMAVFGNGADDDLWQPEMTLPQAVASLRAQLEAVTKERSYYKLWMEAFDEDMVSIQIALSEEQSKRRALTTALAAAKGNHESNLMAAIDEVTGHGWHAPSLWRIEEFLRACLETLRAQQPQGGGKEADKAADLAAQQITDSYNEAVRTGNLPEVP